ncbi:WNT1-inducible-signaling pathway protein 1 isoform X3 [Heterocephalus glaber]|uniref:CCN family member 4 n=1 Tax=Heterocephalus glaber TaxID=10181 RepID=A0AAX6SDH0_HETGA|nr:WNT1-inducible-signaling pathway protein 1 isoform X3 [Heterocephalus glaber]
MRWFLSWALAAVTAAATGSILTTALSPAPDTMGVTPMPPEDSAPSLEFCKWPCECPLSLPRCPLGVSLVTDGCECCKICAQQLGDNCTEAAVCDPHRGLYCDYSRDSPRYAIGVCAPAVSDVEPWHGNCLPYTSPWSPCSTSCGLGISTRVSNANAQCWPEQESRLCNLRPCDVDIRPHIKEGKKCLAVFQPEAPMNFTLAGCVSTRTYRPKYCGVCMDNRCCIPYKSKTIEVSFQCPEGPGFSRKVLWINACFCNLTCRNPNDIFADLELYPEISEIAN